MAKKQYLSWIIILDETLRLAGGLEQQFAKFLASKNLQAKVDRNGGLRVLEIERKEEIIDIPRGFEAAKVVKKPILKDRKEETPQQLKFSPGKPQRKLSAQDKLFKLHARKLKQKEEGMSKLVKKLWRNS